MTREKREQLRQLYEEKREWGKRLDPQVVQRNVEATDWESRLAIVSVAYAKDQVSRTGVNWINPQGQLGQAARSLEQILQCVGYSVRPPITIRLNGRNIEPRKPEFKTVYTTDIVPCCPPSGAKPSPQLVQEALKQQFLERELHIIRPQVILLLGGVSYKAFYERILKKSPTGKISDIFAKLSPSTKLDRWIERIVVPFLHPSGQNSAFTSWFSRFRSRLSEAPQVQSLAVALNIRMNK
jgi:uracil-DNA glycosylase